MPEINSTDKYGCYNRKPLREATFMQNGTTHNGGNVQSGIERIPIYSTRPFRMSRDCQYDKSGSDPRCEGCKHHNPENAVKYAEKPDGNAMMKLLGITAEVYAEFKEWLKRK